MNTLISAHGLPSSRAQSSLVSQVPALLRRTTGSASLPTYWAESGSGTTTCGVQASAPDPITDQALSKPLIGKGIGT